jgi:hypothetical protein
VDSSAEDAQRPPGQARLNGWKEIAAHLGKGVRTAQRWEREYGLPVRRIGREGGEIVFAFQDEIDRWSLESRPRREAVDIDGGEPNDAQPSELAVAVAKDFRRPLLISGLALGIAVLAAVFVATRFASTPPRPSRALLDGRTLLVTGSNLAPLWRHELDFDPLVEAYEVKDASSGLARLIVADLDRDDSNEVMLVVASVAKNARQGVRVFNADGSVRFVVEPNPTIQFGAEVFSGPWAVHRMFVVENPDQSKSLWIAFIHGMWFPTLLVEVAANGDTKSTYWSNGYVERVAVAPWQGRHVVLVGATHNDTRGASLAIFDYGKVAGFAPAVQDEFQCKDCPRGGPLHFIVFPRRCIAEAVNGQSVVIELWVDDLNQIHALAGEGPRRGTGFEAGVWYTLRPDLTVLTSEFLAQTRPLHERFESDGRIDHPFQLRGQHGSTNLMNALKWDGKGFAHYAPHPQRTRPQDRAR